MSKANDEIKLESIRVLQVRMLASDRRIDELERQLNEAREEMTQVRAELETLKGTR